MWSAFLKFLQNAAKKAGSTALKGGKALLKSTPPGQLMSLYDAFSKPKAGTAEIGGGASEVPTAPADYYKSPQAQIPLDSSGSIVESTLDRVL